MGGFFALIFLRTPGSYSCGMICLHYSDLSSLLFGPVELGVVVSQQQLPAPICRLMKSTSKYVMHVCVAEYHHISQEK